LLKAYCITLAGHEYSQAVAERCIRSAADVGGIHVERFRAVSAAEADSVLRVHGLRWTWMDQERCPTTGLRHHRYAGGAARIGCALSHYLLWQRCVDEDEPILVLEHDAVFIRRFEPFDFHGICQINDPLGATRRGDWWSEQMSKRGPGVWPKTWVTRPADRIPDGLAGNSAYVIQPHAARELIALYHELGVWPNDATMCAQLVDLEEHYPFITRAEQAVSTTSA
jgi:GR25 family glycosyltransferase involved in LPS biosynthesis